MPSCGLGGHCTEMLSSPKPNPASFSPTGEKGVRCRRQGGDSRCGHAPVRGGGGSETCFNGCGQVSGSDRYGKLFCNQFHNQSNGSVV